MKKLLWKKFGSYLVVGESNKFKLTDSIIRSFYNRENKIL